MTALAPSKSENKRDHQSQNQSPTKIGNDKVPDKISEKIAEKRRALGRGLESLLPGPRAVPPPAQEARAMTASAATAPAPTSIPNISASSAGSANTPQGKDASSSAGNVNRVPEGDQILRLPIEQIDNNPHQTRIKFAEDELEELADSIRVQGVLQPIVVRPGSAGRYVLILGERRLRASKLAASLTIPVIVKRVSEQQAAEMTLVENLQRQDLNCLEQAAAFSNLSTEFKMTQEEIGKKVGVSREQVTNYIRLLRLPSDALGALGRGQLTYSHARLLLSLHDESQISKVVQMVIKQKMSVALLEDLVTDINIPGARSADDEQKTGGARSMDPNVRAAQRSLEATLGMRVRIRDRKGKGKITIEYGTLEDFDRVVGMLNRK